MDEYTDWLFSDDDKLDFEISENLSLITKATLCLVSSSGTLELIDRSALDDAAFFQRIISGHDVATSLVSSARSRMPEGEQYDPKAALLDAAWSAMRFVWFQSATLATPRSATQESLRAWCRLLYVWGREAHQNCAWFVKHRQLSHGHASRSISKTAAAVSHRDPIYFYPEPLDLIELAAPLIRGTAPQPDWEGIVASLDRIGLPLQHRIISTGDQYAIEKMVKVLLEKKTESVWDLVREVCARYNPEPESVPNAKAFRRAIDEVVGFTNGPEPTLTQLPPVTSQPPSAATSPIPTNTTKAKPPEKPHTNQVESKGTKKFDFKKYAVAFDGEKWHLFTQKKWKLGGTIEKWSLVQKVIIPKGRATRLMQEFCNRGGRVTYKQICELFRPDFEGTGKGDAYILAYVKRDVISELRVGIRALFFTEGHAARGHKDDPFETVRGEAFRSRFFVGWAHCEEDGNGKKHLVFRDAPEWAPPPETIIPE